MFAFLVILIALIGLAMTLIVLVQSGKGGGLAGIAAGGTTQILGARQAPDVLEKATWGLGAAFIILCMLTTFFIGGDERAGSVIQGRTQDAPVEQQLPAPVAPDPGTAPAPDAAPQD